MLLSGVLHHKFAIVTILFAECALSIGMHACRHDPYNMAWLCHPTQDLLGNSQEKQTLCTDSSVITLLYALAIVCMLRWHSHYRLLYLA